MKHVSYIFRYKEDEDFKRFACMIDALAFLPTDDVPAGLEYLKAECPEEAQALLEYFDHNYINGAYRLVQPPADNTDDAPPPMRVQRIPPRY